MNADGTGVQTRLTNNTAFDASPNWLPSAEGVYRIVFHRIVDTSLGLQRLFIVSFTTDRAVLGCVFQRSWTPVSG
jgi:hypothetical protein